MGASDNPGYYGHLTHARRRYAPRRTSPGISTPQGTTYARRMLEALGTGTPAERARRVAVALDALGRTGLAYTANPYDADRYGDVLALAAELMSLLGGRPPVDLRTVLDADPGHVTPKVDVRGAVVNGEERILLMRERTDGRWSLPGGWADPGDTPAAACVREVAEETGVPAEVVKVVAIWDRDAQGHRPALPVAAYKVFFLCRQSGPAAAAEELETLDVGWFALEELPPLSEGRVLRHQLERVLAHARDPSLPTEWD